MIKNKLYALYDENDCILGCFDRAELKDLLNTTNKSFDCIICRVKQGKTRSIKYKDKKFKVYIYEEEDI